MATNASAWGLGATLSMSMGRGQYQYALSASAPQGVVEGTWRRDVSDMLDMLALSETPFISSVGWGPASDGYKIEWISEDLGPQRFTVASNVASAGVSVTIGSADGLGVSDATMQIKQGTVLYKYLSQKAGTGGHALAVVTSYADGTQSVLISIISTGHATAIFSDTCSITAGDTWYVLGAVANEGSVPNTPRPRQRKVMSNAFNIVRQDVQITGTMRNTGMHAIGREDAHQLQMRLKELQRDRERLALYSAKIAKSATYVAPLMDGMLGFLGAFGNATNLNTTTTSLSDTAVNTMVKYIWEFGGRNLTFFGNISQTAKFTQWDISRIRMKPNDRLGGGYVTSYMTEAGIEIDLVPMPRAPENVAFLVDTGRIKLIPKKGRKAIMEKLGHMGDFDDFQLLSEFSLEARGIDLRQHGCWTRLT